MNRSPSLFLCTLLLLASLPAAMAQEGHWPKTLPVGDGQVTIYPLQVEALDGTTLRYRSALAWRDTPDAEPIFGAGWFESPVVIDEDDRVVRPQDLRVTDIRFPDGSNDLRAALETAVAKHAPGWNLDVSLDELNAGLRSAEAEKASLSELSTTPPRIVYRDRPAVLLTLDGEPVLRDIQDTSYQAVVNTPYPLIFDGKRYYLNAARDVWYRADNALGPYRYETDPPAGIAAMVQPKDSDEAVETPAEPVTSANAPEIVVATEPTELIVTDGPAVFVPLVDDLLVLQNSDDDVFMHVGTQQYYVVLAGRWYHADSLGGSWTYRRADQLPAAFARIPDDTPQADARVHVAGTPEANEAVLDAQVPETRAVARGPAEVEVEYDGEPRFAAVDGADLTYAANTGATVLQSNRRYYLVEDGVWYESATPSGPWTVAVRRPAGVEAIAPTSPVYHVKYVYIYDSTPEVVYVGYTPGYLGSYVYYDTVVYGTGWYYRPWVSPWYYYPRPSTWGFHVTYDPWYGWNFGLAWNWGWSWRPYYWGYYSGGYWHHHHHWHHRHRGYWRPPGHHGPRAARYADHGYPRDRYGRGAHRDDRRVYAGGYRDRNSRLHRDGNGPRDRLPADRSKARRHQTDPVYASDLRVKARERDATFADRVTALRHRTEPVDASDLRKKARARDTSFADRVTAPRHRTEPVDASDLREKARARDTSFADRVTAPRHRTEPVDASDLRRKVNARDAAQANQRRSAPPAASDSHSRRAAQPPSAPPAKVARNRTEPVRAGSPQRSERAFRQSRTVAVPDRRQRPDAPATTRRAGTAPIHSATLPASRRAAPSQQQPTRPVAGGPAERPVLTRRDQIRQAPAPEIRSRPGPSAISGNRSAQGPASREAANRSPAGVSAPRAPAPRAAPGGRDSRPTAMPQRQSGGGPNSGRSAPGGHEGARQGRSDRR